MCTHAIMAHHIFPSVHEEHSERLKWWGVHVARESRDCQVFPMDIVKTSELPDGRWNHNNRYLVSPNYYPWFTNPCGTGPWLPKNILLFLAIIFQHHRETFLDLLMHIISQGRKASVAFCWQSRATTKTMYFHSLSPHSHTLVYSRKNASPRFGSANWALWSATLMWLDFPEPGGLLASFSLQEQGCASMSVGTEVLSVRIHS